MEITTLSESRAVNLLAKTIAYGVVATAYGVVIAWYLLLGWVAAAGVAFLITGH